MSQCVGAAATDLSTYLLLGIDFGINMYFTGKVFWLFRKKEFAECGETLQGLVINEFLEFTMPFLFLVCFLAAFHGPNADIIGIKYKVYSTGQISYISGNVKNEYFHFEAVTDIDGFTEVLLLLVFIDALSLVIAATVLKLTCNMNMLQVPS